MVRFEVWANSRVFGCSLMSVVLFLACSPNAGPAEAGCARSLCVCGEGLRSILEGNCLRALLFMLPNGLWLQNGWCWSRSWGHSNAFRHFSHRKGLQSFWCSFLL